MSPGRKSFHLVREFFVLQLRLLYTLGLLGSQKQFCQKVISVMNLNCVRMLLNTGDKIDASQAVFAGETKACLQRHPCPPKYGGTAGVESCRYPVHDMQGMCMTCDNCVKPLTTRHCTYHAMACSHEA